MILKRHFLFAILLLLPFAAQADQLAYLNKADAERAVRYLKTQRSLVIWCACCNNDKPVRLTRIRNIRYTHTGYREFYEITLRGKTETGETITYTLDLAYTHAHKDKVWIPVGRILKMEYNPCVESFGMNK